MCEICPLMGNLMLLPKTASEKGQGTKKILKDVALEEEVEYFVWATGGGKVDMEYDSGRKRNCHRAWKYIATRGQDAPPSFNKLGETDLGFGRIEFSDQEGHFMPYLRIPLKGDYSCRGTVPSASAMAALYYVENVWELPRPKLLISVTGGEQDFPMNRAKENVLYKLMDAARQTDAWIVTGGTDAGITKYVGQARKRFGGNIPLIGICNWGNIQQRTPLTVRKSGVKLGYVTSPPVSYEKTQYGTDAANPALDPNHSHFIMVDDGNDEFGGEIQFRGQFEACASFPRGGELERSVADAIRKRKLGWHNSQDGWGASFDLAASVRGPRESHSGTATTSREQNLSICLAFEGGSGTIRTVHSAVQNRTPVMLMYGSGRAADLLCDALHVFESEGTGFCPHHWQGAGNHPTQQLLQAAGGRLAVKDPTGSDRLYECNNCESPGEDGSGYVVDRAEEDPFDKRKLRRIVLIRRLLVMLVELWELTLVKGSVAQWPPVLQPGADAGDDANDMSWRKWRYSGGVWVLDAENEGGGVDEEGRRTLVPGEPKHLQCLVALARFLFTEYKLQLRPQEPAARVLELACALYRCVSSGLCLIYDLDARVVVDGKPQQLDVLEYTVLSIVRRLESDNDRDKLKLVMRWWRSAGSPNTDPGQIAGEQSPGQVLSLVSSPDSGGRCWGGVLSSDRQLRKKLARSDKVDCDDGQLDLMKDKLRELYQLEKDKQFREVRLLIEWGQTKMVRDMLDELGGQRAWCWRSAVTKHDQDTSAAIVLQHSFLNHALHLTLVHNNSDMARLFLARGADASFYAEARGYTDLLTEAYDPEKNRHLRGCVQAGWVFPSALAALAGESEARSANSAGHSPESFLDAVGGAYEACCEDTGSKFQCSLRDVTDDRQAQAILRRVYANLVHDDSSGLSAIGQNGPRPLRFRGGGDFDAFLLLLFLGRFELAKIFWERDGRNNPSAFLHSALLVCIVCRKLEAIPDVRPHQRDALRQAKQEFESISASILQAAHIRDSERTQGALAERLPLCPWWSAADLIFRGDCRLVVARCADLCEELAERRFGGGGNTAWSAATFARWAHAMGLADTPEPQRCQHYDFARSSHGLLVCALIDAVGVAHTAFPWLPVSLDLLWAPCAGVLVQHLFAVPVLSLFVVVEEFLPHLDLIPGATLTWVLHRAWAATGSVGGAERTARGAQPLDFFVLDVATHVLHTYLLTAALLMPSSAAAWLVEVAAVSLFVLGGVLPDAALGSVTPNTTSVWELVLQLQKEGLQSWFLPPPHTARVQI